MQLSGSRVLVTGASRGIGLAIAQAFAREGCQVVLAARDAGALAAAAAALHAETGRAVETVAISLGARGAAEAMAQRCPDIDILVNNAGAIPAGGLHDLDEQAWRESWDLKVFGYINLARAYMPRMKRRSRAGVIVNIIGAAGEMLDPDYLAGSVGNAALIAFTKAVGSTSLADNLRMVGINPGPVGTERHEAMLRRRAEAQWGSPSRWRELLVDLPHGRAARVEEISAMTVMLASPLSAYTTGTVVAIDGGLTHRRRPVG